MFLFVCVFCLVAVASVPVCSLWLALGSLSYLVAVAWAFCNMHLLFRVLVRERLTEVPALTQLLDQLPPKHRPQVVLADGTSENVSRFWCVLGWFLP